MAAGAPVVRQPPDLGQAVVQLLADDRVRELEPHVRRRRLAQQVVPHEIVQQLVGLVRRPRQHLLDGGDVELLAEHGGRLEQLDARRRKRVDAAEHELGEVMGSGALR